MSKLKVTQLFENSTIERYNSDLKKELEKHNITNPVVFEIHKLQKHVEEQQDFMKGLLAYLKEVDTELNKISEDKKLKAYAFQIIAELSTLVYPNTGASYSLIPRDLKEIDWTPLATKNYAKIPQLKSVSSKEGEKIDQMFQSFFETKNHFPKTLICIISATLSDEFTQSLKTLFISDSFQDSASIQIELKASSWLSRLTLNLKTHIMGINFYQINNISEIDITVSCRKLAAEITGLLKEKKLFEDAFSKKKHQPTHKVSLYIWKGTNLIVYPKKLTLPMRTPPQNWTISKDKSPQNGGFFLSEFTNISYQGYLDSKSFQMHQHKLHIKTASKQLNQLQRTAFMINEKMLTFIEKYKFELTDTDLLLVTDKWLNVTEETLLSLNQKWGHVFIQPKEARKASLNERITKRNETLCNQDMLQIAQLFVGKDLYWPAVHDFRGRIYRISNLNIQMNALARSLICFYSDKSPVTNRKKNKKTFEQFNLLLKEILNDESLIEEWDAVFGNRFINNDIFDKLLFTALKDGKLSLIQISQLLLLRAKEYDKIGIYYDASASAYQIMGVLNLDQTLCELTNVINTDHGVNKKDIYDFFRTELIKGINEALLPLELDKDRNVNNIIKKYLLQMDRQLIKAIVMPLIYGKTAYGFAEDLQDFFAKNYIYPSDSTLLKLANLIINQLKNHPKLSNVNNFMDCLRCFAKLLFESHNVSITGAYSNCQMQYNKVAVENVSVYSKTKDTGVQRQEIRLNSLQKTQDGIPIQSKNKTVNAFVANFIHFIDGQICHFIIEQFASLDYKNFGSIHDSFYIKPEQKIELQHIYRVGLVMGLFITELNYANWILYLMKHFKVPLDDPAVKELDQYIKKLEAISLSFSKERRNYKFALASYNHQILNNKVFIAAIQVLQRKVGSKTKTNLETILEFFKQRNLDEYTTMIHGFNHKGGPALFSDNN